MSDDPAAHLRHELRTPLNAILGYSEMLLEEAQALGHQQAVATLQEILNFRDPIIAAITEFSNNPAKREFARQTLADSNQKIRALAGSLKLIPELNGPFGQDIDDVLKACRNMEDVLNLHP